MVVLTYDDMEDYQLSRRAPCGKKFKDPLYQYIHLGPLAVQVADTEHFQRLRSLKQLGCTSFVFPTAEHSRFSHSLGVAHLAHRALDLLRTGQRELDIRPADLQLVELAGLSHDLGHGPFSHVFEGQFLPRVLPAGVEWNHESMSCRLFEHLVDAASIDLSSDEVNRVCDLIGSGKLEQRCSWEGRRFMKQIVANADNGVDVDKLDYLYRDSQATGVGSVHNLTCLLDNARVVDEWVCYREHMHSKLKQLFDARASMHQEVYSHRKCKAVEYMVVDALIAAEPVLRLSQRVHSPEDFLGLSDSLLEHIQYSSDPALAPAAAIVKRLRRRQLYKWTAEAAVPAAALLPPGGWVNVTAEEVVAEASGEQLPAGVRPLRVDDIVMDNVKIDLSKNNTDPLANVRLLYDDWSWRPCNSAAAFQPTMFMQRKVRVYLRRQEQEGGHAAIMQALQNAFKRAMRTHFGPEAHVQCAADKRAVLDLARGAPARAARAAAEASAAQRAGGSAAGAVQAHVQPPAEQAFAFCVQVAGAAERGGPTFEGPGEEEAEEEGEEEFMSSQASMGGSYPSPVQVRAARKRSRQQH